MSVRVFATKSSRKVVTANRQGVFFVTVSGIRTCDSISVLATGNRCSRAAFNRSWFNCGVRP